MGNALLRCIQVLTADITFQADAVIRIRSKFVMDFKAFVIWIKQQAAESEESIKRFEEVFSVEAQIGLYSHIQDARDELGMLKAVFTDQIQVMAAVGEVLGHQRFQESGEHPTFQLLKARLSRALEIQSQKNLKLVEKLQTQLNEVYSSVCAPLTTSRLARTNFS
jgi:hypothetical protein